MEGSKPGENRDVLAFPPAATAAVTDRVTGAGVASSREPSQADPDLARVADAWPDLPAHIRAAVLALVAAAGSGG